jgi:predicted ATPase
MRVDATRTLLGKSTPCVGREREMETLVGLFDACVREPAARAVVVTGPPGIGKSRLRFELVARVRARGDVEVWTARGDPSSAGSPFGLLGQLVRNAAALVDGESPNARRQRLRARVARHVEAAHVDRVADFLAEIVGADARSDASVEIAAARRDRTTMGDQIRRAWEDWLSAECAAQPVVLVLEDLHWGDLPTVRAIDAALRAAHDRALLVVALARPEVHDLFPRLWAERRTQELRVEELMTSASERLVRAALARASTETVSSIVERAAGNPFYLEELVRAEAAGVGASAPDTVLALVESRLDALDAEARRVLRAASVFGGTFWEGGVATLLGEAGEGASPLSEWVDVLVEREIVAARGEGRFANEREYVFRHALVRDAVYATLPDAERALAH